MDFLVYVFAGLASAFFWSFFLSFVPVTIYLLVRNPWFFEVEKDQSEGIFFLTREIEFEKKKKIRFRDIGIVYGVCYILVLAAYVYNWIVRGESSVIPFNLFSVLPVVLFGISILMYVPIAVFLFIRKPWQFHENRVCLKGTFISYGVCLFIFSLIYGFWWIQTNRILVTYADALTAVSVILLFSALLAYLPTLAYIFYRIVKRSKGRKIHMNTIFIIYSICFLVASIFYLGNWSMEKKAEAKNGFVVQKKS